MTSCAKKKSPVIDAIKLQYPCRSLQITQLLTFIGSENDAFQPLFICGSKGTGKTSIVRSCLSHLKRPSAYATLATACGSSGNVYGTLIAQLIEQTPCDAALVNPSDHSLPETCTRSTNPERDPKENENDTQPSQADLRVPGPCATPAQFLEALSSVIEALSAWQPPKQVLGEGPAEAAPAFNQPAEEPCMKGDSKADVHETPLSPEKRTAAVSVAPPSMEDGEQGSSPATAQVDYLVPDPTLKREASSRVALPCQPAEQPPPPPSPRFASPQARPLPSSLSKRRALAAQAAAAAAAQAAEATASKGAASSTSPGALQVGEFALARHKAKVRAGRRALALHLGGRGLQAQQKADGQVARAAQQGESPEQQTGCGGKQGKRAGEHKEEKLAEQSGPGTSAAEGEEGGQMQRACEGRLGRAAEQLQTPGSETPGEGHPCKLPDAAALPASASALAARVCGATKGSPAVAGAAGTAGAGPVTRGRHAEGARAQEAGEAAPALTERRRKAGATIDKGAGKRRKILSGGGGMEEGAEQGGGSVCNLGEGGGRAAAGVDAGKEVVEEEQVGALGAPLQAASEGECRDSDAFKPEERPGRRHARRELFPVHRGAGAASHLGRKAGKAAGTEEAARRAAAHDTIVPAASLKGPATPAGPPSAPSPAQLLGSDAPLVAAHPRDSPAPPAGKHQQQAPSQADCLPAQRTVILVVDNLELVNGLPAEQGPELLTTLLRLPELLGQPNIALILISSLSWASLTTGPCGVRMPATIFFPAYREREVEAILCRSHRVDTLFPKFLRQVLPMLLRSSRSLPVLQCLALRLWRCYRQPLLSGALPPEHLELPRLLFSRAQSHVRSATQHPLSLSQACLHQPSPSACTAGATPLHSSAPTTASTAASSVGPQQWLPPPQASPNPHYAPSPPLRLPLLTCFALVAAFICSRHPAEFDNVVFEIDGSSGLKPGKRRVKGQEERDKRRLEIHAEQMRGPLAFSLPRWLAMARQLAVAHWPPGLSACLEPGQQGHLPNGVGGCQTMGGGGGGRLSGRGGHLVPGSLAGANGHCSNGVPAGGICSAGALLPEASQGCDRSSRQRGQELGWQSRRALLTDGLLQQLPTLVRTGLVHQTGEDRLADTARFHCLASRRVVEEVSQRLGIPLYRLLPFG